MSDPERGPQPRRAAIRSLFHLTNGEAALVECLCQGLPLDAAAAHLDVTIETRARA